MGLTDIQQELKAPKNRFNSFGNYSYRSCEDILEAVKPLLAKHGATMTIRDDIIAVNDRIYVKATVELTIDKEVHSVTAFAREADAKKGMDASQVTGTASSYARKYALNGMFLIDDTKDADTDEYTIQTKTIGQDKVKALTALCEEKSVSVEKLLSRYKVTALSELTEAQHAAAVRALEKS